MKPNPKFSRTLALVAPITALTLTQASGATDMFLKIEGIKGESSDAKHKDEIQIESFSWGVSNAGSQTSGGGGAGKATFKEFTVTKKTDRSSPPLMLSCATGVHFPKVEIKLRRTPTPGAPDNDDYYVVTLQDVVVSSLDSSGNTADVAPVETLSLNFTKIEWKYLPQDGSAPVVVNFDTTTPPAGTP